MGQTPCHREEDTVLHWRSTNSVKRGHTGPGYTKITIVSVKTAATEATGRGAVRDHVGNKEDGENGRDSRGRAGRQKAWPAGLPGPEKAWSSHMTKSLQLWLQLSHCRPTAVFVLSPFDDSMSSENKASS